MSRSQLLLLSLGGALAGVVDGLLAQTVSFIAARSFAAGAYPRSVVGDFNADGLPDLEVASDGFNGAVSMRLEER